MEDIYTWVREGNAFQVRIWLDNTENDLNQGDDHQFSLLHWAAREGRTNICEMLINRGARINATNMGDDTALHLAAAHGNYDTVILLLHSKANINAVNEHGNTPLHYACFWGYEEIAEHLVNSGALVSMANEFGKTPLDHAQPRLAHLLKERAISLGQDMRKIPFQDRSWLGYQTRSRDATLSKHSGINFEQIHFTTRILSTKSAELWKGRWQNNDIVAKILNRVCSDRNLRDFKEEYPRLRIFNHPNILPVLGGCMDPKSRSLVIISQWMKFRTLYDVLHGETNIVVDQNQALRFALDIARGMEFLHSLDPMIPRMKLNSKHVMIDEDLAKINIDDPKYQMKAHNGGIVSGIDEDLTAKINMADYTFTFHDVGKEYNPAWLSPEALQRKPEEINQRAADMWSYAVLLWELATREVPFADMSPSETGMKVALEGLRVTIPPGTSAHLARLIKICMNEDPGKRPKFDMVIPILEKMKAAT